MIHEVGNGHERNTRAVFGKPKYEMNDDVLRGMKVSGQCTGPLQCTDAAVWCQFNQSISYDWHFGAMYNRNLIMEKLHWNACFDALSSVQVHLHAPPFTVALWRNHGRNKTFHNKVWDPGGDAAHDAQEACSRQEKTAAAVLLCKYVNIVHIVHIYISLQHDAHRTEISLNVPSTRCTLYRNPLNECPFNTMHAIPKSVDFECYFYECSTSLVDYELIYVPPNPTRCTPYRNPSIYAPDLLTYAETANKVLEFLLSIFVPFK